MKEKFDSKRMITIGVVVLIVSVVLFGVGQSQMSAADKELRAYYGADNNRGGVSGYRPQAQYDMEHASYYLPGEQMRDFSVYGIIAAGIILISGVVTGKKKVTPDLLSDIQTTKNDQDVQP